MKVTRYIDKDYSRSLNSKNRIFLKFLKYHQLNFNHSELIK